ncbi:Putative cysteine ligase BshC [Frankliniella fusca]|uniref:Cysteine ligase BshC n=1 Tax=Frankliniella fusca TaxID=407009 RepID=A0AAE1LLI3_9NEOP|nr:Putative cysteine ligase BshC [Frankliniella fusca]
MLSTDNFEGNTLQVVSFVYCTKRACIQDIYPSDWQFKIDIRKHTPKRSGEA